MTDLGDLVKTRGMPMKDSGNTESFVRQLTENQPRLYGYVYSLIGDHNKASDVLLETNLTLWRKLDQFEHDKPFLPWAFSIARFQVMASIRDQGRDRMLLDPELVDLLSGEVERGAERLENVRLSLRECLQSLAPKNRQLIEHRYFRGLPIGKIAETAERSVSAIKTSIMRIRRELAKCVERKLEGPSIS
ncbi:MAG: sigma-70 family RNA polymerase sigma factor [Planctomycetota bacterium]